MVAYNFHKRFIDPIRSGVKTQTIRKVGKRRHAKPGEMLQLYWAMRTKHCCKVIDDVECSAVFDIEVKTLIHSFEWIKTENVYLPESDYDDFAKRDGFEDMADMQRYWFEDHNSLPGIFVGKLIDWGNHETD